MCHVGGAFKATHPIARETRIQPCRTPPSRSALLAVGTYTEPMPHVHGQGSGIHLLRFDCDQGGFGAETVTGGLRNPTYLAASAAGDRLYAVCEIAAAAQPALEVYAVDPGASALTHLARVPLTGGSPCHVSLNEAAGHLYISNYESGNFVVMVLDAAGCPTGAGQLIQRRGSGPRADRQEAPHGHCALPSPDGRHLFLCDLGTDSIARHPIVDSRVAAEPDVTIAARPGAGPRHIAFSPSGRSLVAIHELSSTVTLHGTDAPERTLAEILDPSGGMVGREHLRGDPHASRGAVRLCLESGA